MKAGAGRNAGLAVLCVSLLIGCIPRPLGEVLYFYSDLCPSCEEARRSLSAAGSLRSREGHPGGRAVKVVDVTRDADAEKVFLEAIEKFEVPPEKQRLPLLIIDGVSYSGLREIEAAITGKQLQAR